MSVNKTAILRCALRSSNKTDAEVQCDQYLIRSSSVHYLLNDFFNNQTVYFISEIAINSVTAVSKACQTQNSLAISSALCQILKGLLR